MTAGTVNRARLLLWLESVERAWLGWTLPPADRAIAESGWTPDRRERYCGRCGGSVGPGEATGAGCASCRRGAAPADAVVRLGRFEEPLAAWVRAVKYRGWAEMALALGRELGARITEAVAPAPDRTLIVPMPMPWERRWYRGIDHARLVADGCAEETRCTVVPMLARDNGPPQVAVPRRRSAPAAGMRLARRARRWSLAGLDVVLVDDVRTTGGSLRAAERILRQAGAARLIAAFVAVTDVSSYAGGRVKALPRPP